MKSFMKNLLYYFFAISLLLASSCKDDDDPSMKKGALESATYDHTTNSFTLIYKSGQTDKVTAVIDNSTTPPYASATLEDGTIIYVSNASVSGNATISK